MGQSEAVDPPLVSVILIFLNAEAFLAEAIESVLAQSHRRWELLLVDDGSHDRSPEIAGSYADRDPDRVRCLHHPERQNRGMSASRNLGIRAASGSYLAFLDADDVWQPDKLERQLAVMAAHPEAAMTYGKAEYWHSWTGEPSDARLDRVQEHWIAGDALFRPPNLLTSFLAGRAAIPPPCSVLVRRETATAVGGFEESFRGLYEDQAFYAKICLEFPVFVSNDCLERYRQHPDSICSASGTSERAEAERNYLEWLQHCVKGRDVSDVELGTVLDQQTWLARTPRIGSSWLHATIRRAKKWWLKVGLGRFAAPL